jgi:hypothetical protein
MRRAKNKYRNKSAAIKLVSSCRSIYFWCRVKIEIIYPRLDIITVCRSDAHQYKWDFTFLLIGKPFCAVKQKVQALCAPRYGTSVKLWIDPASSLTSESLTSFFSIYSDGGHFVQQSGACQRYASLKMELITPVKLRWNPTSRLTCES